MACVKDSIISINGSLVQHGKHNNRVYIISLDYHRVQEVLNRVEDMAIENNYTKIFCKVPDSCWPVLKERGYLEEARIPDFFNNREDCLFCSRFFSKERAAMGDSQTISRILNKAVNIKKRGKRTEPELTFRKADREDAELLSALYRRVFVSYPFPIDNPEYIRNTMDTHVTYYIVQDRGRVIAAASCDKDNVSSSVEMTDFATLPYCRGRGLAMELLGRMEEDLISEGRYHVAYTIARALSTGINIIFSSGGYAYGGTLVNNTNISGNIESMNVWYKRLKSF